MSTPSDPTPVEAAQTPAAISPAGAPDSIPDSPASILAQLSGVQKTQPVHALLRADELRMELTSPLLEAIERALADQQRAFEQDGVLSNYATYLLAKWREPRAFPLFIRWLSLPGEGPFEVGGDTVIHAARLLASVYGGDLEPIKTLILNREANQVCRGQAIGALAVLAAWDRVPRQEIEDYLVFLARAGLERHKGPLWDALAKASIDTEALAAFPDLRRAGQEGLIDPSVLTAAMADQIEHQPRGLAFKEFVATQPPITDTVQETRWWSGYQEGALADPLGSTTAEQRVVGHPGFTYTAPPKVGRNDLCPCGSGKKFKKCCGQ